MAHHRELFIIIESSRKFDITTLENAVFCYFKKIYICDIIRSNGIPVFRFSRNVHADFHSVVLVHIPVSL